MESTRVAFLETLTELMEDDPKTVVVFADSVKVFRATAEFLQKFAGRVFDVGIAERNAVVATAAGLADLRPDRLRRDVRRLPHDAGVRAGPDVRGVSGPGREVHRRERRASSAGSGRALTTHQFFEDLAIVRGIPGVTVVVPADAAAVRQATRAIARGDGARVPADRERA